LVDDSIKFWPNYRENDMEKEIETLIASDGLNTLLRDGKPACIGYLQKEGSVYFPNTDSKKLTMIAFDFENDGVVDYWFFSEEGLEFNFIHPNQCHYIRLLYMEAAKAKDINTFLNCVVGGYTARAMGFVFE
jgi:hypothetical protein